MSAPKTNYKAWLSKAENDLLNIENNLAAANVPWDIGGFQSRGVGKRISDSKFRIQEMGEGKPGQSGVRDAAIGDW